MTELSFDGTVPPPERRARQTPTMKYPLPPEPERVQIVYDGWGRYKLPAPQTGRPTAFTRSTTVAGTLDDTYNLNRWKRRETVKNILTAGEEIGTPLADMFESLRVAVRDENKSAIDKILDAIDNACGARDAAELGSAVHEWLEALDTGQVLLHQIPAQFQPYAVSYQAVLARYGLVAEPQYVERIVLNDRGEQTIAGTLDRIYRVQATGELILGDVKSSRTLEYSYLTYAIQLAVYGYATKILALDGSGWEPMPEINQDYAVILHVPSDQPERADLVTIDLWQGGEGMITALDVRRRRTEAKSKIPFIHAVPVPTPEALQYVRAHQALQNISCRDDLIAVWEEHKEVWDDALTSLGEQVSQALTATAHANAEGV